MEIILRPVREHGVDVRVAPRAEQVMHAPAVLVLPVAGEAVVEDGAEGAHIGEGRPEAVVGGEVGGVELAGA